MASDRIQSTAETVSLNKGPMDMPDRGKSNPQVQTNSTNFPLTRKESPVAQFGARPSQGTVQTTSESSPLKRNPGMPYDGFSKTKEQFPIGGGKGKKG